MKITFRPSARDDLQSIFARIAKDSPRSAIELTERIERQVYRLATPELSHIGHAGTVPGTLEIIVRPYIIVYKVFKKRSEIVILSIAHGAQNR